MASSTSARIEAVGSEKLIHGDAHRHGAAVADRFLGVLDHFAQQPDAVFERAAIFVGALIGGGAARNSKRQMAMPGIDIDDVKAGAPARAAPPPPASPGNHECHECPWPAP